jgi:hypothetical protein
VCTKKIQRVDKKPFRFITNDPIPPYAVDPSQVYVLSNEEEEGEKNKPLPRYQKEIKRRLRMLEVQVVWSPTPFGPSRHLWNDARKKRKNKTP